MGRKRTGSIVRHRGVLRVVITDDSGKRVWLPTKFSDTPEGRSEAEDHRDQVRIQRNRGEWASPQTVTVEDYAPVFVAAKKLDVRPNTHAEIKRTVNGHILRGFGTQRLTDVTVTDVRGFYGSLLDSGLTSKMVRNIGMTLRQLFDYARTDGLIVTNPVKDVRMPKAEKQPIDVWAPSETQQFLAGASEPIGTFAAIAATTRMRRSEILGLTWDAVDLESGSLTVTGTVVNVESVATYRPMQAKTTGSLRTISLETSTVDRIRAHRATQNALRLSAGEHWENGPGFLFTGSIGRVLNPSWITRRFQSEAGRIGLTKIGPHGLRHSYATTALAMGVSVKVVQERLGHSNIATTLDVYSHVTPEQDREAAEAVAAVILGNVIVNDMSTISSETAEN